MRLAGPSSPRQEEPSARSRAAALAYLIRLPVTLPPGARTVSPERNGVHDRCRSPNQKHNPSGAPT